jgi:hypothetical protein
VLASGLAIFVGLDVPRESSSPEATP